MLIRGDARSLALADHSVDLIITSPPYFGLRSYTDGGEHYAGQVGSEPTPAEWVEALLECTREWIRVQSATQHRADRPNVPAAHPLGRLPGSVWEIATEPLSVPAELGVDHFAAFPSEWPRRLILGYSPEQVCQVCGEGLRPVVERTPMRWRESPTIDGRSLPGNTRKPASGTMLQAATARILGESCSCPEPQPTKPGVILDPFGGTGTTALVADVLGRVGISNEMSSDYCRLAAWRTTDPGERARAMRVPRPEPVHDDQFALFAGGAA